MSRIFPPCKTDKDKYESISQEAIRTNKISEARSIIFLKRPKFLKLWHYAAATLKALDFQFAATFILLNEDRTSEYQTIIHRLVTLKTRPKYKYNTEFRFEAYNYQNYHTINYDQCLNSLKNIRENITLPLCDIDFP